MTGGVLGRCQKRSGHQSLPQLDIQTYLFFDGTNFGGLKNSKTLLNDLFASLFQHFFTILTDHYGLSFSLNS